MARTVLPELKVRAKDVQLNIPYRIPAYAAKSGRSPVSLKVQRIGRSN